MPAVDEHPDVLLGVERVSVRRRKEHGLRLGREHGLLQQAADHARNIVVGERREGDRERVALASAPSAAAIEQLRASGADHEHRHAARPIDEMVDEVEQCVVGPVKVLEHEHERVALRQRLEKASPGRRRFALAVAARGAVGLEARQRPQVLFDPGGLRFVADQVRHGRPELGVRLVGGVGVQDAGLGGDHLAQRPVGDAVAVRQRPALAPRDEVRLALDRLEELPDEPALADAGNAHERDQLYRSLGPAPAEGVEEEVHLGPAADERRRGPLHDVDPEAGAALDRLPRGNRPGLALGHDRLDMPVGDRAIRRVVGRLADEDAVDGCGGLEARGRVDDVAGRHSLSAAGIGPEDDQRLAGVHADAHVQVEAGLLLVQPVDRSPDRERRADRALGIVLVGHRRAEERHDGVADELLDRPPVVLELVAQERVVRRQGAADVLDVHALAPAREPDEIGEEHRDDLALLTRGHRGHRRAAAPAEPEPVRVLLTALWADRHAGQSTDTPPGEATARR